MTIANANSGFTSPAIVDTTGSTSATQATGSFSPAAGSLVVIVVNLGYGTTTSAQTVTVADSNSVSYAAGPAVWDSNFAYSGIFWHYYASAPGSITVTATRSPTGGALFELVPYVLTGAASSQSGAASKTASASTGTSSVTSVTTTVSGSWVISGTATGQGEASFTASGLTSDHTEDDTGDQVAAATGHSVTGTPGATSLGFTWTGGTSADWAWTALEILPATATFVSDTDASAASDSASQVKVTPVAAGMETSRGTDSNGVVEVLVPPDADASRASDAGEKLLVNPATNPDDASTASDAGETTTAHLSSSDASSASDSGTLILVNPATNPDDASSAVDAGEKIRVIPVASGDEQAQASDGGEAINGGRFIHDTETVQGVDSGFSFISDTEACRASDGSELLLVNPAGFPDDGCTAADQELRSWPHDSDTVAATENSRAFPHDTDACSAAEAQSPVHFTVTDACTAADSEHETVYVYAFQTLNRWTGGGFQVVFRPAAPPVPRFQAGPSAVQQALEPHRGWVVADHDECRAAEAEHAEVVPVAEARPALRTGAWARSLGFIKMEPPAGDLTGVP